MFAMIGALAAGQARSGAAPVAMPGGFRARQAAPPPCPIDFRSEEHSASMGGVPRVGLERRPCVRAGSLRLARFPAPGRRRVRSNNFPAASFPLDSVVWATVRPAPIVCPSRSRRTRVPPKRDGVGQRIRRQRFTPGRSRHSGIRAPFSRREHNNRAARKRAAGETRSAW
jgi:hypothetical protein